MVAELNTGIAELLAKKAERDDARKERRKERADKGEINYLQIERTEHGLYYARYTEGGNVPRCLDQYFTHKGKLLDAINGYYGSLSIVKE